MADPRFSQNAARLSEDIGDVLTAIRRMIADDDALSSARDSIRADRTGLVQDDAGEFLARRYGGNAALARQMVETAVRPAPAPAVEEVVEMPPVPQFILRARPEVVPPADAAPLRLGAERRVEQPETPKPSGWRSWLRPELREAAPQVEAATAPAADSFSALVDDSAEDEEDFAEAFDWKARMRPEIEGPKPVALAAGKLSEQRASGWVMSPDHGAVDTVAHLAAEAAAFDAEQRAVADADDEDRAIRELLREMVQEELNGELGQRFSANLRAVIRREIAAAIDAHLDRF